MNALTEFEIAPSTVNGVKCVEIAEKMGFNLGCAFALLWQSGFDQCQANLECALSCVKRHYSEPAPWPQITGYQFREHMATRRAVFNRPSPWCECVRQAMAAICDLCTNPEIAESERICRRAIQCIETALEDERSLGRGLEP